MHGCLKDPVVKAEHLFVHSHRRPLRSAAQHAAAAALLRDAQAGPVRARALLLRRLLLVAGCVLRPLSMHRRAPWALTPVLSQREGAFSFEPAWSFPHDEDVLSLGEAALPHPVVADLNGDGRREARRACTPSLPAGLRQGAPQVIVATHDARLLVLEQPRTPDARCGCLAERASASGLTPHPPGEVLRPPARCLTRRCCPRTYAWRLAAAPSRWPWATWRLRAR